jgi:hypothetical protein
MPFVPYSAKNARVTFNSVAVVAKRWQISEKVDRLDTTNFESSGLEESIAGIKSLSFTIELDDDSAATIADRISTGLKSTGGVLKFFLNASTAGVGPYWQITTPFIESRGYNADVKSPMGIQIQGTGSGTYVAATGAPGATS